MKTLVGLVLSAVILTVGLVFVRYDARYQKARAEVRERLFEDCDSARLTDPDPARLRYYLTNRQGAWAVRIANADAPMSVFLQKADAERFAVEIARASCPSQLFIQGAGGRFEEVRVYGEEADEAE